MPTGSRNLSRRDASPQKTTAWECRKNHGKDTTRFKNAGIITSDTMKKPIVSIEEILLGINRDKNGKIAMTSMDRYQQLINDCDFRTKNEIELGNLRKREYEQIVTLDKEEFSRKAASFSDGGIEFLTNVYKGTNDQHQYFCKLYIPKIDSFLEYNHPVKNKKYLKILEKC